MADPTLVIGFQAKMYRNTGSYGTPTWTEMPSVHNNTLNMEANEADVTTRGNGGFKATAQGLIDATIEFDMVWSKTAAALPADITAVKSAFLNRTSLDLYILDGAVATVGSEGLRATCAVLKFSREETIDDTVRVTVTIKPTMAEHQPAYGVIAS